MQSVSPHWDIMSLLIYCIMALFGGWCAYMAKRGNRTNFKITNRYYFIWFFVWEIFATFRGVGRFVGGADAASYITYFDVCLQSNSGHVFEEHADLLYRLLNQAIRLVTDDYHILFFVIYALLLISYFLFIEEFAQKNNSFIPLTILFYIYLRGFTTVRTNLAVASILFAIVAFSKGKKKSAIVLTIASVFLQKASVIYAGFLVFLYMYRKKNLKMHTCAFWIIAAGIIGKIGQYIIATVNIQFFNTGAYKWYAVYSQHGTNFLDSFWKIAFPQMVLAVVMYLLHKEIKKDIQSRSVDVAEKLNLIYLICIYDIILIPVTYILNIWRGYEYLYIARLIMWGEIIHILRRKFTRNSQRLLSAGLIVIFMTWMIFRIYNTWEDSGLMPYVFEPIFSIFH